MFMEFPYPQTTAVNHRVMSVSMVAGRAIFPVLWSTENDHYCPQPRWAQSMQRAVGEPQAVFIRTFKLPEVSCSTGHIEDQILLSRNTEPTAQMWCMFRGSGANGDVPAPVKRQQTRGLVQIFCPEVLLRPRSAPLLVSQSE